jgi:hypothetical protein
MGSHDLASVLVGAEIVIGAIIVVAIIAWTFLKDDARV